MKKFVFSLATLAKHKATLEKQQKAELARVMRLLNALYEEQNQVTRAMTNNAASQERALQEQLDVLKELERHDNYHTYLRLWLEDIKGQIAPAEAEKKRIQAVLLVIMREIKTLDRLRAEQYQAYLAEERREENLTLVDLISSRYT